MIFRPASLCLGLSLLLAPLLSAQATAPKPSSIWAPDQGDGTYRNPVLFADYSDPDAIRVGSDFYLVSSSFDQIPGLPILHSTDLVNWSIIGHALAEQPPVDVYNKTGHGNGVWAPAIRWHNGEFYIYYPDPEYGIYVVKAKKITGPWSKPKLIKAAKGWIDPCPLWDDDGNAYLINGVAASRSGIKNELILSRMSPDGETLLDEGTLVIDGHGSDTTLEGPKIYKRSGYYYVFAPAGGVPTGYQVIYRASNIYGPYERKVVLAQGKTAINGPHQGAWVTTAAGEDWFLHFQDREAWGRVVLLEPMRWEKDWPVMGINQNNEGVGEPVTSYRKPKTVARSSIATPADSDESNAAHLGAQWQWQANPQPGWALPSAALGVLRLQNIPIDKAIGERLWTTPNVLTQKVIGPSFTATTKLTLTSPSIGDRSGLVLLGLDYAYIAVRHTSSGLSLVTGRCLSADKGSQEQETTLAELKGNTVYLRVKMDDKSHVSLSWSEESSSFHDAPLTLEAKPGRWIGAKVGLFAQSLPASGEHGYVDVDWFRMTQ
jgi:beta-xylosidase